MKKILATLALLAGALYTLSAVPAYPGKIQVKQPDGSVVTVRIHGDEWLNYITDESGRVVARDADGFFRPAAMPTAAQREEAAGKRRTARQMQAARARSLSKGRQRILVVLANFSDIEFTVHDPKTAFWNLLNQEGYKANGGTGSVRDYYIENSHGAYEPEFDVYGPVTLSKTAAYYAGDNGMAHGGEAVQEACGLLDKEIDFSQYDGDGDGRVDLVILYFAGYNQAEGAPNTIWPHQSSTSGQFDHTKLGNYLVTSELRGGGYYGSRMCGIGTTTHEFGHFLGLPDFYDTDNDHGEAGALYSYSLMCSGSYLNDGCTPPYLNSEERKLLGWMDDQPEIPSQGELTILPVQENVAYKTLTTMEGEYFVYECRTKTGWDLYLPSGGMLVYHVDKSARESLSPGGWWPDAYKPINLWENWQYTNMINAFGSHPCFYLVPAASQSSLNYTGSEKDIPFPGNRKVKKYTPVDWQEEQGDFRFSDIAFDGSQVTMNVILTTVAGVQGVILNTAAKPVRGATVSIYRDGASAAPAGKRMQRRSAATGLPLMSVTTDVDGTYVLEDTAFADGTFTLVVSCDGYVETEATVEIGRRMVTRDFYLRKVGESEESTFMMYDPEGSSFVGFGYGDASYNLSAGIHLTAEEATAFAGKQIKLISFQPFGDESSTVEAAYVFVEAGGLRKFTQKVDDVRFDAMNTVNVVSQGFYIAAGTDLYIGYGLVGCSEDYPLLVQPCEAEKAGYLAPFSQSRVSSWSIMQTDDGSYYTPVLSASVGEPAEPELGFNHIANPGNGSYQAGDRFELALVRYEDDPPSSVAWKFDGMAVQADSVSLTAGSHTVEAHLTYPDGSVEVIRLVITAM